PRSQARSRSHPTPSGTTCGTFCASSMRIRAWRRSRRLGEAGCSRPPRSGRPDDLTHLCLSPRREIAHGPAVASPTRTVVVLHSEACVLELSDRALRNAGHHVLVTHEPAELVELAHHVWIDVVVMDVTRRDGDGIVSDLRWLQPHVRIVQEVG